MNNSIELIKTFTKQDYMSGKVNLHIHSTYSDGKSTVESIIKQAENKGYRTIAITDHNTIGAHLDYQGASIITGVEFDVWYKYIFLHLLAYGIDVNYEGMKKFYAKDKRGTEMDIVRFFAQRDIKELIKQIHNAGGIAVLAHPACCWALNMEDFVKDLIKIGLDGLEVYYPYPRWRKYIKFSNPDNLEELADKYNLIKTGGTDFHGEVL